MKIDIHPLPKEQNIEKKFYSSNNKPVNKAEQSKSYMLDLGCIEPLNQAYRETNSSVKEFLNDVENQDVAVQSKYLAVMSNFMSAEDFEKLKEEGFPVRGIEVEEVVTVLDRIKASLAEAGICIEGFTDEISKEQLEKITGSISRANKIVSKLQENDFPVTEDNIRQINKAMEMAEELFPLSEGAKKYVIENEMDPSIKNLYKAEFSGAADAGRQGKGYYVDGKGAYFARKADNFHWEQLEEQIKQTIEKAGLEVNHKSLEDAKWLIEKGIPLTKESLQTLNELEMLPEKIDSDHLLDKIIHGMKEGKLAEDTQIAKDEDIVRRAQETLNKVRNITNRNIENTIKSEKEMTLNHLIEAEDLSYTGNQMDADQAYRAAVARRQLEEIRLKMTVDANIKLLKSGFSIDTSSLEDVVSQLRKVENEYYKKLMKKDNPQYIEKYKEAVGKLHDLERLPAAVLGKFVSGKKELTVHNLWRDGNQLKDHFIKAGETYEALKTEPRKDLGDSIKKAFRNVDAILKEMNLEVTEQNRRAVRILGYNHMEVTEENISKMKTADQEVQTLLERMQPGVTLEIIRKGINPLDMTIEKLNDIAAEVQDELGVPKEKYSEFLWKVEKSNEITKEEKEAYIGVYRLLHRVEQSDGAVIGSVLNQNAQLNLRNLLSAVRNKKKEGMDIKIDDEFGGLDVLKTKGPSISEQIEGYLKKSNTEDTSYLNRLVQNILDKMDPTKLHQMEANLDTTLEQLNEGMIRYEENIQQKKEYVREQLQDIRSGVASEEDIIKSLLDFNQPITLDSLFAAAHLMNERGSTFRKLTEKAMMKKGPFEESMEKEWGDAVKELHECLGEEKGAKEAYANLTAVAEKIIESSQEDPGNHYVDLRELQLLHKEISLAGNLSREENYEVPIEINGKITSINLKIQHKEGQEGKVTASMEVEPYGKIGAKFQVSDQYVKGLIVCTSEEGVKFLAGIEKDFQQSIGKKRKKIQEFHIIQSENLDFHQFEETKAGEKSKQSTKTLYEVAKEFIRVIQK